MNPTAMTKTEKLIADIRENREQKREECKKAVQEMLDNKEISYCEALNIFEESRLFEISSFIIGKYDGKEPIDLLLNEYDDTLEYKYQVIMFSDVSDWIEWQEGEVEEALDAAGITDNPHKILYDYAIKTNYIGYTFDW
jgi:hypothetical protein